MRKAMQSKAKQYNAQQCKARNRSISDQVRQHSSHSILVCMGDEPRQYDGSRSMPSVRRPTKGGGKAYPSGDKPDEARTETTSKANPKGYKANVNAGGSKGTKGDGKRSRDGAAEDEEQVLLRGKRKRARKHESYKLLVREHLQALLWYKLQVQKIGDNDWIAQALNGARKLHQDMHLTASEEEKKAQVRQQMKLVEKMKLIAEEQHSKLERAMEKMNTLMSYSFVDFSSSSEDECSPKEEAQTSTAVDGRTSTRH